MSAAEQSNAVLSIDISTALLHVAVFHAYQQQQSCDKYALQDSCKSW